MELIGIQIASIAFSIFMIYFSHLSYKRGYFEIYTLIVWLLIFTALIVATLFPNIFMPFVKLFKFSRLFDLFVVIGLFFLIVITFLNFLHTQQIKIKMEKLVQNKALKGKKSNQGKTS